MAKPSPWKPFVCSQVKIEWKSEAFDWHYFYVISCAGSSARLRGIDDQEAGVKHIGDEFDALWDEVFLISPVTPRESSAFFDMENGVLEKAKALVDGRDKSDHYGPPEESMRKIALIWSGILGVEISAEKVALMMLGLKMARLSVNPRHTDSLIDAGGYVRILERLGS